MNERHGRAGAAFRVDRATLTPQFLDTTSIDFSLIGANYKNNQFNLIDSSTVKVRRALPATPERRIKKIIN